MASTRTEYQMNFIGSLIFMILKRYMAGSTLNKNIYTGKYKLVQY